MHDNLKEISTAIPKASLNNSCISNSYMQLRSMEKIGGNYMALQMMKDSQQRKSSAKLAHEYEQVLQMQPQQPHLQKMFWERSSDRLNEIDIKDYSMHTVFQGNGGVSYNKLALAEQPDDGLLMHMGWDTILSFKFDGEHFTRIGTRQYKWGDNVRTEDDPVSTILTRGVNTCTVVYLLDMENHVGASAHLDAGELNGNALAKLVRSVERHPHEDGKNPIVSVFSLMDDRNVRPYRGANMSRAGFVRALIRFYYTGPEHRPIEDNGNCDLTVGGELERELKRDTHPDDSIEIINRGRFDGRGEEPQVIHPEIGILCQAGELYLFYSSMNRAHKDLETTIGEYF